MEQYFYGVEKIMLGPIQPRDNNEHERLIQITDTAGRVSSLRLVSSAVVGLLPRPMCEAADQTTVQQVAP